MQRMSIVVTILGALLCLVAACKSDDVKTPTSGCTTKADCRAGQCCNNNVCIDTCPCSADTDCGASFYCSLLSICTPRDVSDGGGGGTDVADAAKPGDTGPGKPDVYQSPDYGSPIYTGDCAKPELTCDPKAKPDTCPAGYFCESSLSYCVLGHCKCQGCSTGQKCNQDSGYCEAEVKSCTADADCSSKGPRWKCNAQKECEVVSADCHSDADCNSYAPAKYVCDTSKKGCVGSGADGDPCPNGNGDCKTAFICLGKISTPYACREDCTGGETCTNPKYKCSAEVPVPMPGLLKACMP